MNNNEFVEKYITALSNLCGVDYSYMRGDPDVDAIIELISVAVNQEDLINRQKAEIERLNGCVKSEEVREIMNSQMMSMLKEIVNEQFDVAVKLAMAEAVKEFAERCKAHARKMQSSDFSGEFWDRVVLVSDIDNLVKEMVGQR